MFTRSESNPILKPMINNDWQSKKIYNPTVIYENNLYHLFYRAIGQDYKSRIVLAFSKNGEKFIKQNKPAIWPVYNYESQGVEDPRITKLNDLYYLTYNSYDCHTARLCLAISNDLKNWKKTGPILKNWDFKKAGGFVVKWDLARIDPISAKDWSKAGGIFPAKINKKFLMLFGDSNIWLAKSNNGKNWLADKKPFLKTRSGRYFDNAHIEMGPPPIKTEKGWLVLYHGIDKKIVYRLGFLLLDLKNPRKIIYRSKKPIFEPTADYELEGIIDITNNNKPKVIFCCGAVIVKGNLRIYYGCGDTNIATAQVSLDKILQNVI